MFKNVAIHLRAYQSEVQLLLAGKIRKKWSCKIHFYVNTEQDKSFLLSQNVDGIIDTIGIADHLTNMTTDYSVADATTLMAAARELEIKHKIGINKLSVSNRHFGRGFALAGFGHPRSRMSETIPYEEIVNRYVSTLKFWIHEFAEKEIDLLISGTVEANAIARESCIPFRAMVESRLRNRYMWAVDQYDTNPEIADKFAAIEASIHEIVEPRPPEGHLQFRKQALQNIKFSSIIKKNAYTFVRHLYWLARGYAKAKGYYLSGGLMMPWAIRQAYLRNSRRDMLKLADIKDKSYVFYPLHTEPEKSLQGLSPEYFFQLETIAAIARDLPVNVKLVVKEHLFGLGRRPRDFYDQICEFKNVILLDINEYGIEVVHNAKVVVTISSTAGLEACYFEKPVITFGSHNLYNFMDNVTFLDSTRELKAALADALKLADQSEPATMCGIKLEKAIEAASFPMGEFTEFTKNSLENSSIEEAFQRLIISLDKYSL
jgi:capsule polysaccharide modification protein KpsS